MARKWRRKRWKLLKTDSEMAPADSRLWQGESIRRSPSGQARFGFHSWPAESLRSDGLAENHGPELVQTKRVEGPRPYPFGAGVISEDLEAQPRWPARRALPRRPAPSAHWSRGGARTRCFRLLP